MFNSIWHNSVVVYAGIQTSSSFWGQQPCPRLWTPASPGEASLVCGHQPRLGMPASSVDTSLVCGHRPRLGTPASSGDASLVWGHLSLVAPASSVEANLVWELRCHYGTFHKKVTGAILALSARTEKGTLGHECTTSKVLEREQYQETGGKLSHYHTFYQYHKTVISKTVQPVEHIHY